MGRVIRYCKLYLIWAIKLPALVDRRGRLHSNYRIVDDGPQEIVLRKILYKAL